MPKIRPSVLLALFLAPLLLLGGCVRTRCCPPGSIAPRGALAPAQRAAPATETPAAPLSPTAHSIYRGDGRSLDAATLYKEAGAADVIFFGELHGNAAGSLLEHDLLQALAASGRPFALAMEFFERDVQADLDTYLAGELDEAAFIKRTRQGPAYPTSHAPLIELCKQAGAPVIAANAPRSLVSAFRKSKDDYETFLAARSASERATLPRTTTRPDDPYRKRFVRMMGPKRGPSYFRSQALWDDAMSEAISDFRAAHPDHVVVLVVGGFHVARGGGSLTKLHARRPKDRIYSIVLSAAGDNRLRFDPTDRGAADAVISVRLKPRTAPRPKAKPDAPSETTAPRPAKEADANE